MPKHFLILFSVCCLLSACQSNGEKAGPDQAPDSSEHTVTQVPARMQPTANILEDPDTTDTIPAGAYGINTYGKQTKELVRAALQKIYKDDLSTNAIPELSRKFIFFEYDLNDDSTKEIFVGLTGSYFCGTGGCTILLMNNDADVITTFTVSDYPVVIAGTKTKSWKDLIIKSNGKNHLMKFDGKKYPSNPSVQAVFSLRPGDELPLALDFKHEPYPRFVF